jgi:lantibiotic biosynthesis protein
MTISCRAVNPWIRPEVPGEKADGGFLCRAVLADGDNEWLVDFRVPLWLDTFRHMVAGRPRFVLKECFPGPGEHPVQTPEGRFCHELIVPFLRRERRLEESPGPGTAPSMASTRP